MTEEQIKTHIETINHFCNLIHQLTDRLKEMLIIQQININKDGSSSTTDSGSSSSRS